MAKISCGLYLHNRSGKLFLKISVDPRFYACPNIFEELEMAEKRRSQMNLPIFKWRSLVYFVLFPILFFLPFGFAGWLHFIGHVEAAYIVIVAIAAVVSQIQKPVRNPVFIRLLMLIICTTAAGGELAFVVGDTIFEYPPEIPLAVVMIPSLCLLFLFSLPTRGEQ